VTLHDSYCLAAGRINVEANKVFDFSSLWLGWLCGSPGWTVPLVYWRAHRVAAKCANRGKVKMLSLCILLFSGFALIRFAVSQWRAIWISSANQPLSDSLQLMAGIDAAAISPQDFGRLLSLCDQLSPELKTSSPWLNEVSLYYRAIAKLDQFSGSKVPSISVWAAREMQTCARYVAVVLDQNLAMNLDRRLAARAS
jgi:hypothetical protein